MRSTVVLVMVVHGDLFYCRVQAPAAISLPPSARRGLRAPSGQKILAQGVSPGNEPLTHRFTVPPLPGGERVGEWRCLRLLRVVRDMVGRGNHPKTHGTNPAPRPPFHFAFVFLDGVVPTAGPEDGPGLTTKSLMNGCVTSTTQSGRNVSMLGSYITATALPLSSKS